MSASTCQSCGRDVVWAVLTLTGAGIPLDPEQLNFAAPKLVALNHETGGARVLKDEDLAAVERWRERGVTIHRSHWATCPTAAQHRVHPKQEALAL